MPELIWKGKEKVVNHHHDAPFRVLRRKYEYAAPEGTPANTTGNMIIHGDNLEALKALLPEYEGRVKCIYIDPPYNTGNEGWIYNDNVNDPRIRKWLGQVVGKEGEDLTRHDKWLCMMYPRLKLLHRLLADDGAIFVSIDDNEAASLKLLLDEIFGGNNFVSNVIWQKNFSTKNDAKQFSSEHDFVAVYAKDGSIWRPNLLARTEKHQARYKNPDNDPRGPWASGDLLRMEHRDNSVYVITSPTGKEWFPDPGTSWRHPKEEMDALIRENHIWFGKDGNSKPRRKKFSSEVRQGIVPQTIWKHEEVGHTQEAKQELQRILARSQDSFATPKPVRLIERVLHLATDKDAIVLDSFAGSGTTAQAVLKLNQADGGNRKFILVEMMDYAETITAERARRVMAGYGAGDKRTAGLGGGFAYYEMGESLFLPDGNLNEALSLDEIRRYVAFSEKIPAEHQAKRDNPHTPDLLGLSQETAYFFCYRSDSATTLDLDWLAALKLRPSALVIYADLCLLERDFMQQRNIIFKKIPRDITRF